MKLLVTLLLALVALPVAGAETIVVTATGDINLGTAYPSEQYLPPDQGRGLLARVRELLVGDVVFGNLEGPIADSGQTSKCSSPRNCYAFRTPTALAPRLREAGFTVLSLANNHALDFGEDGRRTTMQVLDRLGIAHSGAVGDVATLELEGKSVALVAFTTAEHSYNLLDLQQAEQVVRDLAAKHDLVVVSFHGGSEGRRADHVPRQMEYLGSEPRGELRRFAHLVIDAGADLVLGHGPHVLRGLEVYRRRLIAYSLGNFCTYGRFNLSGPLGLGMVLQVELRAGDGSLRRARILPTRQFGKGGVEPDPQRRAIGLVRRLSREDFGPLAARVDEQGLVEPPPGDGAGLLADPGQYGEQLQRLLAWLERQGFSADELTTWFGDERARLLPEVIERFERPAERLSYQRYRRLFVKPAIHRAARRFLEQQRQLLEAVERRYRVDRLVLAAIVATETRFGEKPGDIPAFNALATVVLAYPRRSNWARRELSQLLSIYRRADPLAVRGSYAGAIGLVQFMPTSIAAYGVDHDGDGRIDLSRWPDALASAANYLRRHGYRKGRPWRRGQPGYRAVYKYNPSHNYARVIGELARLFGKPPAPQPRAAPGGRPGEPPAPSAPSSPSPSPKPGADPGS